MTLHVFGIPSWIWMTERTEQLGIVWAWIAAEI